ncbi:MAG: cytochrome c [Acidimicrobiia bacterium]|nr:cytochrome c [Acidimicrobiia bacterium]
MARPTTFIAALVVALAVAACGGGTSEPAPTGPLGPGDIERGQAVYKSTCQSCHGGDATGISGLGKALKGSEFVASLTEVELAEFVKAGRPTSDPANTTGLDMPAKGGNPSLNDQQLRDVAAYLRSLN